MSKDTTSVQTKDSCVKQEKTSIERCLEKLSCNCMIYFGTLDVIPYSY